MGRQSGFIAMNASMASGLVDICLIPEVSLLAAPGPDKVPLQHCGADCQLVPLAMLLFLDVKLQQ